MPRHGRLSTVHPQFQEAYFNHLDLGHKPNPLRAKPARRRSRYERDGVVARQSTAAAFYHGVASTLGRRRGNPPPLPVHDEDVELSSIHTNDTDIEGSPMPARRLGLPASQQPRRGQAKGHRPKDDYLVDDDPVRNALLDQVKQNKGRAPNRDMSKTARKRKARRQLRAMSEKRPLFVWYATTVMVIVQVCTVVLYDVAPLGLKSETEPNANLFYGPLDEDLVQLGALYPPCVRADSSITKEIITPQIEAEDNFGCCVDYALFGSGCWSSIREDCPNSSSVVFFPDEKCGGPHCCNDPDFWPDCQYRPDQSEDRETCLCVRDDTVQTPRRPCCFGLAGQCKILSEADCTSKQLEGTWHPDLELCSQVSCLEEVCGLSGFRGEKADQWYRPILAIWLHTGVLHCLFVLLFFHMIAPDVERLAGWFRFGIIFFASGIGGFCTTALLARFAVTMGGSGACFGVLGAVLVEMVQKWSLLDNPKSHLIKLLMIMVFVLGLGTLPYIDQFAHVGGLAFGTLTSIAVLPFVTTNQSGKSYTRQLIRIVCGAGAVILMGIVFTLLYTENYPKCDWCQAADCINYLDGICETHTKDVNSLETEE
eukprot:m.80037 g.80037  ORF g.80037 m.80037 type:complete len:595 (-) comp14531_c0_seq1:351-2135(-)